MDSMGPVNRGGALVLLESSLCEFRNAVMSSQALADCENGKSLVKSKAS